MVTALATVFSVLPAYQDEFGNEWYESIINNQIMPLIEEYYFDKLDEVNQKRLISVSDKAKNQNIYYHFYTLRNLTKVI